MEAIIDVDMAKNEFFSRRAEWYFKPKDTGEKVIRWLSKVFEDTGKVEACVYIANVGKDGNALNKKVLHRFNIESREKEKNDITNFGVFAVLPMCDKALGLDVAKDIRFHLSDDYERYLSCGKDLEKYCKQMEQDKTMDSMRIDGDLTNEEREEIAQEFLGAIEKKNK